jgi:hypothetical protein
MMRPPLVPTLTEANLRQREALLDALEPWTEDWPAEDVAALAALFDVLWSIGAYERLVADWQLSPERAIGVLTWAISLVEEAVRAAPHPLPHAAGAGAASGGPPGSDAPRVV